MIKYTVLCLLTAICFVGGVKAQAYSAKLDSMPKKHSFDWQQIAEVTPLDVRPVTDHVSFHPLGGGIGLSGRLPNALTALLMYKSQVDYLLHSGEMLFYPVVIPVGTEASRSGHKISLHLFHKMPIDTIVIKLEEASDELNFRVDTLERISAIHIRNPEVSLTTENLATHFPPFPRYLLYGGEPYLFIIDPPLSKYSPPLNAIIDKLRYAPDQEVSALDLTELAGSLAEYGYTVERSRVPIRKIYVSERD